MEQPSQTSGIKWRRTIIRSQERWPDIYKNMLFFFKNKRLMAATGTQNDAPFSSVPVAGLADA